MEEKLLEQRVDNTFRGYQDDICEEINKFHSVLMSAYGKNLVTEESVVKARESLQKLCSTEQYMGYTRRVRTDFVEHVEQSLLCGQVPECQMKCTKMNNSADDPMLGHVVDVVYEIAMPVIVKSEKLDDDDDNLVLIGVTPGIPMSAVPVNVTVKKEKIDDSQESEKTNMQSQFSSPVFGNKACESKEGDSENKDHVNDDPEEEQEIDVMNSSQGSKRLVDTQESEKTGKPKRRKKTPIVVSTEQSLRSRTVTKDA